MPFAYTPPDGYKNTTSFPTTPSSETEFRASMQSLLDQVRDYLNQGVPEMPVQSLSRQAIINGNFDVCQRGTSFTNPTSGGYTADRIVMLNDPNGGTLPANIVHSRQPLTPGDIGGSFYFYRIAPDGAGSAFGTSAYYRIGQRIEQGVRNLCGASKKVTVSFWARSSIAGKRLGVFLQQLYGSGGSPSAGENLTGTIITLSTGWTKYSYTFTTNTLVGKTFGTNNDDVLAAFFAVMWGAGAATAFFGGGTAETFVGAGNIDIAQIQVCAGDAALPFQPRAVDDETKKSLRYTCIPQTNSIFARLASYTANVLVFQVPLPVQLKGNPTIRGAINTDILVYNMAGAAQTGFTASAVVSSNGVTVTLTKTAHGLTDGYLEIKTTSGFDAEL